MTFFGFVLFLYSDLLGIQSAHAVAAVKYGSGSPPQHRILLC